MKLFVTLFFLSPIIFALLDPSIFLSTQFLTTLYTCFSLNVKDHVSHQYQTTDKITVLYILISMFTDSKQEAEIFCS